MGKQKYKRIIVSTIILLSFVLGSMVNIPQIKAAIISVNKVILGTTSDGYLDRHDANYGDARNAIWGIATDGLDWCNIGQWYLDNIFTVSRAPLYFDTSIIPSDANFSSAILSLYISYDGSVTDFNVTIQNGQPTYPHDPMDIYDYYYIRYSGNGGSRNTNGIAVGYWNITLNANGTSWINKDGTTKLMLRSQEDIDNSVPTTNEHFNYYNREKGEAYSPKLYVTYETSGFPYIFHGLYNENTGLLTNDGVNVTAYFTDGSSPQTFEVNGTYNINFTSRPRYFLFDLSNDREYWQSEDVDYGEIYIFEESTTVYTIAFLDLAGVLDDYPFVEAKRYINGTLRIVERRRVDVDKKIVMSLINSEKYNLIIKDGSSYTFGDLVMTSTTTIQLTLKGIDFPKETLLIYKYVRIYGTRRLGASGTGNITITYQDTLEQTTSVDIYINYKNGTNIYNATETTNSFSHVWASALNNTDYAVVVDIDHQRFGAYTWKQYFPRSFSDAPWGLDFLGNLPFATSIIIPMLLILFVAGCFSVINAEVGAFMAVVTAAWLTYMGWIAIEPGALITAFALAILMAIIYAKRNIQT